MPGATALTYFRWTLVIRKWLPAGKDRSSSHPFDWNKTISGKIPCPKQNKDNETPPPNLHGAVSSQCVVSATTWQKRLNLATNRNRADTGDIDTWILIITSSSTRHFIYLSCYIIDNRHLPFSVHSESYSNWLCLWLCNMFPLILGAGMCTTGCPRK